MRRAAASPSPETAARRLWVRGLARLLLGLALFLQGAQPVLALGVPASSALDQAIAGSLCSPGHAGNPAPHAPDHTGHACAVCTICSLGHALLAPPVHIPVPHAIAPAPRQTYRFPAACGLLGTQPRARDPPPHA